MGSVMAQYKWVVFKYFWYVVKVKEIVISWQKTSALSQRLSLLMTFMFIIIYDFFVRRMAISVSLIVRIPFS